MGPFRERLSFGFVQLLPLDRDPERSLLNLYGSPWDDFCVYAKNLSLACARIAFSQDTIFPRLTNADKWEPTPPRPNLVPRYHLRWIR